MAATQTQPTSRETPSQDVQYVGVRLDINWALTCNSDEVQAAKLGSLQYFMRHKRQQGGQGRVRPV